MSGLYENWWTYGQQFPWLWRSLWLGPVQIPPLPPWFGVQDRVTGTTYWLTLSTDQQHVIMSTTAPVGPQRVFAPWDGPFVGAFGLRFGVSNAHIAVDPYPEQGAGPWARTPTNFQAIAGFRAQSLFTPPDVLDHLAIVIGSATNSIFEDPKLFLADTYPPGDTSDVLSP